jgi:hypothetical protein
MPLVKPGSENHPVNSSIAGLNLKIKDDDYLPTTPALLVGEAQGRVWTGIYRVGRGRAWPSRDEDARLGVGVGYGMGGCAHGRGCLIDGGVTNPKADVSGVGVVTSPSGTIKVGLLLTPHPAQNFADSE